MKKLIKTINYIHENNIIHRDIHSKNIMYNIETNKLKLVDFGIAKNVISNELNLTCCGEEVYQSPEMNNGLGYT